jgi:hypothetical protein
MQDTFVCVTPYNALLLQKSSGFKYIGTKITHLHFLSVLSFIKNGHADCPVFQNLMLPRKFHMGQQYQIIIFEISIGRQ